MLQRRPHRLGVFAFALLAAMSSFAQLPGAATALPEPPRASSRLPTPSDTGLPGIDPRQCGTSRHAALCAMGRWAQYSTMEVSLKAADFEGHYAMERPASGEAHTTLREQWPRGGRGAEIVFVAEDAFAYRSRQTYSDNQVILDEIMAAPNMAGQLAAALLDQAARIGPREITTKPLAVTARSASQYLRTETPSTAALYGPPWEVSGTVRATSTDLVAFSLRFTFTPVDKNGRLSTGRRETLELKGTANYAPPRARMPESFDLVGWKLVKNGNSLQSVGTLGEARGVVGAP